MYSVHKGTLNARMEERWAPSNLVSQRHLLCSLKQYRAFSMVAAASRGIGMVQVA